MSLSQVSVTMNHYPSGGNFVGGVRRDSTESTFTSNVVSVTTSPESISVGDIIDPRFLAIKNISGSDLLISIDGGSTYVFRLAPTGESILLRFNAEDNKEVNTIVCEADVSDSLDGDYIELEDQNGLVWAWFNTGAGAGAPTPMSGERLIEVSISTDAAATAVAIALAAALDADSEFSAPVPTTATVVATDAYAGVRSTGASAGTTGWSSVTSDGSGAAYFNIRLKSATTSTAHVAILPN